MVSIDEVMVRSSYRSSWIARSWFVIGALQMIVDGMHFMGPSAGIDDSRSHSPDEEAREHGASWTVGKVIELLDDAIDAAGSRLARAGGLSVVSPSPFDERDRPVRPRRSRSSTRDLLEESERDHDVGLTPGP